MCCCPALPPRHLRSFTQCQGSTSLESSGTQSSINLAEHLNRSKESCQLLGLMHAVGQDKRALGLGSRSHHGYSGSRHYLGHALNIHCQGTASSCAFCIPPPGSITSRKSVLEKTRIEVVEPPQSHQSLKNPSWAQHPLHPSRQQG